MPRFSSSKRPVALLAAAFLLCGVLHVVLYGVPFMASFSELACGAVTVLWALSAQKRITDRRLLQLVLWTAAFLLLYTMLQVLRYQLIAKDTTTSRFMWYSYYVPMSAIPLLCLFIALCVHRPADTPLPAWCLPLTLWTALLALGFLTNDLHFLAFRFPSRALMNDDNARHGVLFFLYCVHLGALLLAALLVMGRKCRAAVGWRWLLVPALPELGMVALLLLNALGRAPRVNGIVLWQAGGIYTFGTIGFLETCIQIGLIPANSGYESAFALAGLPAVILNDRGEPVYRMGNTRYPFPESAGFEERAHAIRGGSIHWLVDVSRAQALNERLAEATQQIEARNAYLAEEGRTRQERAELETRNRLYDRISRIVQPQLEQIEARVGAADADFAAQLPQIAVLCAYVKRRSNMELLAAEDGLTLDELRAAVAESLETIRLSGARTALSLVGGGDFSPALLAAAYEHFESIVEACQDTLEGLLVVLRAEEGRLSVRMLLQADAIQYETPPHPAGEGFARHMSVSTDGLDTVVVLTLTEGGGAA